MAMTRNQGGGVFADINITPLTDIFLVLLIIFMVTTAVTIESAAHVDLPKAEAAAAPDRKAQGHHRHLHRRTSDYLNDKQVTEPELVPQLHDALAEFDRQNCDFPGRPKGYTGRYGSDPRYGEVRRAQRR